MDKLLKEINNFKRDIDPELAHLDLFDFVKAVALTPKERKLAESYLKKIKQGLQ
jgi:hypothetical protein